MPKKSKQHLAALVIGSGAVTEAEVVDLLNDFVGENDIYMYFPTSKALFTPAVAEVVDWCADEDLYPVVIEGEKVTKKARNLGHEEIGFNGWDEVLGVQHADKRYLIVAVPDDDADDYDWLVEMIEKATEAGWQAVNLCAGLDDITLDDGDDITLDDGDDITLDDGDDEKPLEEPTGSLEEDIIAAREKTSMGSPDWLASRYEEVYRFVTDPVTYIGDRDALASTSNADLFALAGAVFIEMGRRQQDAEAPSTPTQEVAAPKAPKPAAKPTETPKRTVGRPRTTSRIEKQWFDEMANPEDGAGGAWMKRGRGRLAAGTRVREENLDTGEVTNEAVIGEK